MSDERLERIEKRQDEMADDIKELKTDVKELKTDVKELKTDVRKLKTDVAELKTDVAGLKTSVCGLEGEVKSIKENQAEHSEMLVFIVQQMNAMTEDNRRWFEMAQENHRDEMRAWRDAFQIDRERLDDHEDRLNRLEAC